MSDAPVDSGWVSAVPEPTPVSDFDPSEFDRAGSMSLEDYIAGLKKEFKLATGESRSAIKAELDRVAGPKNLETAVAPRAEETA